MKINEEDLKLLCDERVFAPGARATQLITWLRELQDENAMLSNTLLLIKEVAEVPSHRWGTVLAYTKDALKVADNSTTSRLPESAYKDRSGSLG